MIDDKFYAEHDDHDQGVYLVTTFLHGKETFSIFSCKHKVESFLSNQPEESSSVVIPFIVDEPNWGNTTCQ